MNRTFEDLAHDAGVHFMGVEPRLQTRERNRQLVADAQATPITASNSGILTMLSSEISPQVIEVLLAPMKAAEIVGEQRFGDWTTRTMIFPLLENTGVTAAYGDYNESGASNINVVAPQRQSFHYQTMTVWGEKEMADMSLMKIDVANRKNVASVLALNKYQNKTYFFGVSGLQNYGLLNDPNLTAALTPATKAATGVTWVTSGGVQNATALEVVKDIDTMYIKLQVQVKGVTNMSTPMKLAMSPRVEVALSFTNDFGQSVRAMLAGKYPNLTFDTAPEYSTASGELVQLIVPEFEAQATASCAFTEKLRAHPIILGHSSFSQKKSQGSFGCVVFRPMFIVQLLGV